MMRTAALALVILATACVPAVQEGDQNYDTVDVGQLTGGGQIDQALLSAVKGKYVNEEAGFGQLRALDLTNAPSFTATYGATGSTATATGKITSFTKASFTLQLDPSSSFHILTKRYLNEGPPTVDGWSFRQDLGADGTGGLQTLSVAGGSSTVATGKIDPNRWYQVKVNHIEVATKMPDGGDWDYLLGDDALPDPYVCVSFYGDSTPHCTGGHDCTNDGDCYLSDGLLKDVNYVKGAALRSGIGLKVFDYDDTGSDELMGNGTFKPTDLVTTAPTTIFSKLPNANYQSVFSVDLEFVEIPDV